MRRLIAVVGALALALPAMTSAQVRSVDPNQGIDRDLAPAAQRSTPAQSTYQSQEEPPAQQRNEPSDTAPPQPAPPPHAAPPAARGADARANATTAAADTYKRDDLIAAGEGVFGKGAEGLAGIVERILKDQGQPNAYIAGREAGGAVVVGVRYGSGVLNHRVEGPQPVYWTGPSVGFDLGGDANKVFALVYNLYDTADLYHRFPGAEGRLYFVGGFAATYLRRGNIVVIPIRLGVGWRAGLNVNYMKFSHKSKWLPF